MKRPEHKGQCLVVGECPKHKASLMQPRGRREGRRRWRRDPVTVAGVWCAEGKAGERVCSKAGRGTGSQQEAPWHADPGMN